jgi:uncharacterized repeat protein (TIGR01451 family)
VSGRSRLREFTRVAESRKELKLCGATLDSQWRGRAGGHFQPHLHRWSVVNADNPEDDKRKAPRQRTLKGAKVVFKHGQFTYDCTVRNISDAGAQLVVTSTDIIPNHFDLVFEDRSPTRTCNVVWRTATKLGVVFEPPAPA